MGMTPQTCPLDYLPGEILIKIAQDLDLHSANRLARTCRAFQDLGEARVWAELTIPQQPGAVAAHGPRITAAEAIAAFRSRPVRTSFLRRLTITPPSDFHEVSTLLDLVKESITELELCDPSEPWFDDLKLDDGQHLLKPLGIGALAKLQALTMPLVGLWGECAMDLLAAAPRLEVLVVRNGMNNWDLPVVTTTKLDVPDMPDLRVLMIGEVLKEYVPFVTAW